MTAREISLIYVAYGPLIDAAFGMKPMQLPIGTDDYRKQFVNTLSHKADRTLKIERFLVIRGNENNYLCGIVEPERGHVSPKNATLCTKETIHVAFSLYYDQEYYHDKVIVTEESLVESVEKELKKHQYEPTTFRFE